MELSFHAVEVDPSGLVGHLAQRAPLVEEVVVQQQPCCIAPAASLLHQRGLSIAAAAARRRQSSVSKGSSGMLAGWEVKEEGLAVQYSAVMIAAPTWLHQRHAGRLCVSKGTPDVLVGDVEIE